MALGVARVHPEQLAGEERGFLAAGAGANFEQHVLVVVGIARRQQQLELLFQRGLRFCSVGSSALASSRNSASSPSRTCDGSAISSRILRYSRIAPTTSASCERSSASTAYSRLLRDHRRIADAPFEFGEALFDSLELIEHRRSNRHGARVSAAADKKNGARLAPAPWTASPAHPDASRCAAVRRELQCYFLMPYLRLNRSTRPAVSTSRCVPV